MHAHLDRLDLGYVDRRAKYRFKRLTGRSEVAICSRDYKFYSPRHKFRRSPQAAFDIPETSALAENENSPLVCSSGFRPPNELTLCFYFTHGSSK
ncbi:hypothetical protein SEVIR_3G388301v4 [Setaria viridis]